MQDLWRALPLPNPSPTLFLVTPNRYPYLILSHSLQQGFVLDAGSVESLASGPKERLTWSSPPLRLLLTLPYIITQLAVGVNLSTLCLLNLI